MPHLAFASFLIFISIGLIRPIGPLLITYYLLLITYLLIFMPTIMPS